MTHFVGASRQDVRSFSLTANRAFKVKFTDAPVSGIRSHSVLKLYALRVHLISNCLCPNFLLLVTFVEFYSLVNHYSSMCTSAESLLGPPEFKQKRRRSGLSLK